MDKLFSMRVFKNIADLNSFAAASARLNISSSACSKYIKHLEDYLNVRLINRTSRRLSLTDEGKIFYQSCVDILNDFDQAEEAIKSKSVNPKGLLKIAVPVWFSNSNFTDALSEYQKKYPEVIIEVALNDRLTDLVEEGIDIALRITSEPHSTLIARRICEIKFVIAASKKYLSGKKEIKRPWDIEEHKFIVINHVNINNLLQFKSKDKSENAKVNPAVYCNNTVFAAQAAASGLGLAFIPEMLVKEDYLKDKLEILLSDYSNQTRYFLYAVYTSRRFLSPKVRTFIDFIVDWYKES